MPNSSKAVAVFVSSTSRDLEDYRAVARNVLLDLHWRPEMMEHFDAMTEPTVEACTAAAARSDLILLIVAWRQGWVPTVEQGGNGRDSITALELAHARRLNIPVLILMASKSWPGDLWEDEQAKREWVRNFRDTINQPAAFFDHEPPTTREAERLPAFRAVLKQNLLAFKERILRTEEDAPALEVLRSARDGLLEGTTIPVLGCGIYGDGPLSSQALSRAMRQRPGIAAAGEGRDEMPLATAAECRERFDGSRDDFLRRFRKLLEQQSAEAVLSPLLDLLAGIESLTLIVSATYDRLLENRLAQSGRKHAIVAHVIRSYEGREDGKVLILRPGRPAEFCPANLLSFAPDELVVYKPHGSPYLHDGLDPDLEIDTVVVTETDLATFLPRLNSDESGVPNPFRTRFRRSPLLFLGYTMEAWHYRLMMMIFQSTGRQGRKASTLAVRVPDAEVEELAWKRLNTDLIRMDPNQFARSAKGAQTATE
jgi:hypothetical protein